MRRLAEPSMPDHMHWYRVIGADFSRWKRARQFDAMAELQTKLSQASPAPSVQSSGEACAPSPETDRASYERWLNSGA